MVVGRHSLVTLGQMEIHSSTQSHVLSHDPFESCVHITLPVHWFKWPHMGVTRYCGSVMCSLYWYYSSTDEDTWASMGVTWYESAQLGILSRELRTCQDTFDGLDHQLSAPVSMQFVHGCYHMVKLPALALSAKSVLLNQGPPSNFSMPHSMNSSFRVDITFAELHSNRVSNV